MEEVTSVDITKLNRSHTQLRVKMSRDAVQDYAESMRNKKAGGLPPVVVFADREAGEMYLADGYHRVAAAELNEQKTIKATVREGTLEDAILYAANCNKHNAVRFTNADKRKAVLTLLSVFEGKPHRWIADQCGVSQPFVSAVIKANANVQQDKPQRVSKSVTERFCESVSAVNRFLGALQVELGDDFNATMQSNLSLAASCQALIEAGDFVALVTASSSESQEDESESPIDAGAIDAEAIESPATENGYQEVKAVAVKKRGRPPKRLKIEKHRDGWYVVDSEGEIDDHGPLSTKQKADEIRVALAKEKGLAK